MKRVFVAMVVAGLGAGCAQKPLDLQRADTGVAGGGQVRPVARPTALKAVRPPAGARTVAQFDTTSTVEKQSAASEAKAAQASGAGRFLGRTVASLGDPADPGLWLRTPLLKVPAKGRVVYPANGKAVQLDLIPIEGTATAGSRLSLPAFRVIEAPLTGLPEVEVYTD